MTTRHELDLENQLSAARKLCGFQLEKIQRLKAEIRRQKKRVESLESRLKLADLAGAEA